jgi:hypothetical protein
MNNDLSNNLLKGKVGKVVEIENGDDWDDDNCFVLYDGKKFELLDEVNDIDSFFENRDVSKVVLFMDVEEGFCLNGLYFENDKVFWLDIMNDYNVFEVKEVN